MSKILAEIHNDHRNYSQLLELIRIDIDKLVDSASPDYIRLYDIMNYMTNYPDLAHHPIEEIIFTEIARMQPALDETVKQLNREHKQLASIGHALKESLQCVTSGSIVSRKSLIDSANDYHQLLTNHMNTEESKILPAIATAFDENDWSILEAQIIVLKDSLFADVIQEQFSDLYERITLSKKDVA